MKFHLGCSGWYYQGWENLFYKDLPKNQWFKFYAQNFNTVELNSPFYHFPKLSTAKTWYRNAPDDFVYSVKANRMITHLKKFKGTKKIVDDFYKVVSELREKLGCVLFQLPPNVHYHKEKLKEIIKQLNPKYKNVLEFRHPSWWNKETYELLKDNNIIFCIVSGPGLPEDFIKTSKDIYIRLHGKSWYDYNYSKKELREYAQKIKKAKAKTAWAYFNNDYYAYAPKNCLELMKLLN